MAIVNAEVFIEKPAQISQIYAIIGAERFLQIEALEHIKKALSKKFGSVDFTQFTSANVDIAQVLDEVRAGSLFSSKNVAILDVPAKYFDSEKVKQILPKYIEKPSKTGILIILTPSLRKNSKIHKVIASKSIRIECEPIKTYKLAPFINKRAKKMNLVFEDDSLDFLIESVGLSVGQAVSELEKLSIYLGDKQKITKKDIYNVLGFKGVGNIWSLVDSMFAGEVEKVAKEVYTLMELGEEPLQLVALIIGQVKNMWTAVAAFAEGNSPDDSMASAGIPKFKWREFSKYLRIFDTTICQHLHKRLIKAELDLKFSTVPNKYVFEFLVIRLTQEVAQFKRKLNRARQRKQARSMQR